MQDTLLRNLSHDERKKALVFSIDRALWDWVSRPEDAVDYTYYISLAMRPFMRVGEELPRKFLHDLQQLAGRHVMSVILGDTIAAWPREEVRAAVSTLVDRYFTNDHAKLAEQLIRILEKPGTPSRSRLFAILANVSPTTPSTQLADISASLLRIRKQLFEWLGQKIAHKNLNPYKCFLECIEEIVRPLSLSSGQIGVLYPEDHVGDGKWLDYARGVLPWFTEGGDDNTK